MSEDLENIEEGKDLPEDNAGKSPDENSEPVSKPEENSEKTLETSESQEIKPIEHSEEAHEKKPPKVKKEKVKSEKPSKEEEKPKEDEKSLIIENLPKESNYQVSLINENLLKIRLSTLKSVSIDCSVKDRTSTGDSSESQTNKIQIHPKPDNQPQEVEIIISIDPESGNIVVEKKKMIL
jgi:DNA-nicking Smr family endonuclease